MQEYLRKLSTYVAENPPDLYSEDADTLLDALHWAYCETAGEDGEAVQRGYDDLNLLLQGLPAEAVNTVINTVNDLCWEHDRLGFINGFKIGMRLEQELSQ